MVADHDPVPCHHHQYMQAARGEVVPECPNMSERGSLYCTDHQTDPEP